MHIKSEIDDLKIFLITSSGFLKSTKCMPSTYVSTEITNFFGLSKKTSSFRFKELLFLNVSFEKYVDEYNK